MTGASPLGTPLPGWTPPPFPAHAVLEGRYARLEPLSAAHADPLFAAQAEDRAGAMWDYMPVGPFADRAAFAAWVGGAAASRDPQFYAVRDLDAGRVTGSLSLLRIAPEAGSVEVGFIAFTPALQRRRAGTEAVWLLMDRAFRDGYRRFEWKCNALNAPSRRAALRYGLSFEGVFRQAMVVKGRNRDTAWYAAIDAEYPALRAAFTAWLDPANFDADGQQICALSALTAAIPVLRG